MSDINPFRAALDWFGPNGENWMQGDLWNDAGTAACAVGGLDIACNGNAESVAALSLLAEIVSAYASSERASGLAPLDAIPEWNDDPSRLWVEVEAVFEKAAVRWDERL